MRILIARILAALMLLTAAAPAFASADMAGAHALGCDMMAAGHDMQDSDMDRDASKRSLCPLAASCMAGMTVAPVPEAVRHCWGHVAFGAPMASGHPGKTFCLDPPPPRLV